MRPLWLWKRRLCMKFGHKPNSVLVKQRRGEYSPRLKSFAYYEKIADFETIKL